VLGGVMRVVDSPANLGIGEAGTAGERHSRLPSSLYETDTGEFIRFGIDRGPVDARVFHLVCTKSN
jgi:hypothetical protein